MPSGSPAEDAQRRRARLSAATRRCTGGFLPPARPGPADRQSGCLKPGRQMATAAVSRLFSREGWRRRDCSSPPLPTPPTPPRGCGRRRPARSTPFVARTAPPAPASPRRSLAAEKSSMNAKFIASNSFSVKFSLLIELGFAAASGRRYLHRLPRRRRPVHCIGDLLHQQRLRQRRLGRTA